MGIDGDGWGMDGGWMGMDGDGWMGMVGWMGIGGWDGKLVGLIV